MLIRKRWLNLNGRWDLTIRQGEQAPSFEGEILVPYPVESNLSGVGRRVNPEDSLIYRRNFSIPIGWADERIYLNFEAVDWHAVVRVNGKTVGEHTGGYAPFGFDISNALVPSKLQLLEVEVRDPSDSGPQPRGKQSLKPQGIFYTPTSGIWLTVWLEPVSQTHILNVTTMAHPKEGLLEIHVATTGGEGTVASVKVLDGDSVVAEAGNLPVSEGACGAKMTLTKPRLWSPADPHLYQLQVELSSPGGKLFDSVESYAGMRTVEIGTAIDGHRRILLNGQPIFLFGPLDQGFWPDGLHTPPTHEAMLYDLKVTQRLGFNMVRKHVKVEPRTWYAACDRLGLVVIQDMPNGDWAEKPLTGDLAHLPTPVYETEFSSMVDPLVGHPSICAWVVFNEGWGQHDTERLTAFAKAYDPSRITVSASGWTDHGVGDFNDIHEYPGPKAPPNEPVRAAVLGEFGGLGLPIEGHTWQGSGWGYKSYSSLQELTDALMLLMEKLEPLVTEGLAAAVYTQTTDVETELNGLLTYDRAFLKVDERKLKEAIRKVFAAAPGVAPLK